MINNLHHYSDAPQKTSKLEEFVVGSIMIGFFLVVMLLGSYMEGLV